MQNISNKCNGVKVEYICLQIVVECKYEAENGNTQVKYKYLKTVPE